MLRFSKYNYIFSILLFFVVVVLLYASQTLSISYKEALNVFVNYSVLSVITKSSIYLFGQNDFALRIPFLLFYVLSVLLMYINTKNYFKYEKDRLISIFIFMLLPGLLGASLLVNSSIVVTFCLLLYMYIYKQEKKHCYVLLVFYLFIDNSFAILYLAILLQSIKSKDKKILIISSVLFLLSIFLYGFTAGGKPKGFLFDTIAIYATIFSPLLFLYFVYTLYRAFVRKENRNLTWYISFTAFVLSLIISFRQKVYIEDFAPYVVIWLPYMIKSFLHSYRVRLSEFRRWHKVSAVVILSMLLLNVFVTIENKLLYKVLPNPKKHFAYKYHFVKELAKKFKNEYPNASIITNDKELQLRLKFYGIKKGDDVFMSTKRFYNYDKKISISYYDNAIVSLYLKKL